MAPAIRPVYGKDGKITAWYAVTDVGTGGKRRQRRVQEARRKDVEAELARIRRERDQGTYCGPWKGTVEEMLDSYEKHMAFGREANTRQSYRLALRQAREFFGHRKAQSLTLEDIEDYRDHLIASGRRRGGQPGTGLGAWSVNLALAQLSAAFTLAERNGRIARNPGRFVQRMRYEKPDYVTWDEDHVRQFTRFTAPDRLAACWLLSLLGLRRGEVLGLRWPDVSFTGGTLTIARSRVLVGREVIEKGPKSRRTSGCCRCSSR